MRECIFLKQLFKIKSVTCRKISVVYGVKKVLQPLLNKKIRYYSIPHCFVFELYHGVSAMQYSLFSTHRTLLPHRPSRIPGWFFM